MSRSTCIHAPLRIAALTLALSGLAPAVMAADAAASQAGDAKGLDYFAAKQLADRDEAGVTEKARPLMLKAQKAILDAAIADCAQHQAREDFSAFTIVMRLDDAGRAVETWRQGSSPLAICVQRFVRDKPVFIPPQLPFHTALEVSFTK